MNKILLLIIALIWFVSSASGLSDSVIIDGFEFSLSSPTAWVSYEDPELNNATVYTAIANESHDTRSLMTAQVTGPAVLTYNARQKPYNQDFGGLFINDVRIHYYYSKNEWKQYSYQIDEGVHKIEFQVDHWAYSDDETRNVEYGGISIASGYQVNVIHRGGFLSVSPERASYNLGQKVSLSVSPIEGNEFIGWTGDAESDSKSLVYIVDGHVNLDAKFKAIDLGFGRNLRFSDGVSVFWQNDDVRNKEKALMAISNPGPQEFTIEVDLDYSGILSFDRVDNVTTSRNIDDQTYYVDEGFKGRFGRYYNLDEYSFSATLDPGRSTFMWKSENVSSRDNYVWPILIENIRFTQSNENDDSYGAWAEAIGLNAGIDDGPNDDPNGDGVINLLHFAFDTNPIEHDGLNAEQDLFPRRVFDKDYLVLRLPMHRSIQFGKDQNLQLAANLLGMTIKIQSTSDLADDDLIGVSLYDPGRLLNPPRASPGYQIMWFMSDKPISSGETVFMRITATP